MNMGMHVLIICIWLELPTDLYVHGVHEVYAIMGNYCIAGTLSVAAFVVAFKMLDRMYWCNARGILVLERRTK